MAVTSVALVLVAVVAGAAGESIMDYLRGREDLSQVRTEGLSIMTPQCTDCTATVMSFMEVRKIERV